MLQWAPLPSQSAKQQVTNAYAVAPPAHPGQAGLKADTYPTESRMQMICACVSLLLADPTRA